MPPSSSELAARWTSNFDISIEDLLVVFDNCKGRAPHPKEEGYFEKLIHFWHSECGIGDSLKNDLHMLRFGRNGHDHKDAEKWQRFRQSFQTEDDVLALMNWVEKAIGNLKLRPTLVICDSTHDTRNHNTI